MRNVLILGGLGFIGSNLIEELLDHGEKYNIFIFDIPGKNNRFADKVKLIHGDFSNFESLESIFSQIRIDIVIHLISTTIPASSNEKIIYDIEANLVPTVHLLKLLVKYKVPEIIFFSSGGSVYGVTGEEKVDESHSTFPISSHGTIKLTIEKYIHLFQELYGINYLILRVGNPYGPYQSSDDQGIINVFIRKILKGEKLVVRGDGSAVRDYIYVKDVARIVRFLMEQGITNDIINIGSGKGVTINAIIDILDRITCKRNQVDFKDPLPSDVPKIVLDTTKLNNLIKIDLCNLEDGIRRTYESLKIAD
jgi:UDP-glucose 4-epimerase